MNAFSVICISFVFELIFDFKLKFLKAHVSVSHGLCRCVSTLINIFKFFDFAFIFNLFDNLCRLKRENEHFILDSLYFCGIFATADLERRCF